MVLAGKFCCNFDRGLHDSQGIWVVLQITVGTTAAESMSAAANIFVGQVGKNGD